MTREQRLKTLIRQWRKTQAKRASLEYEAAGILHSIRAEFPSGKKGDDQCVNWFRENLDVHRSTATKYLNAAKIYSNYDQKLWRNFGGYPVIQLLSRLKKSDANRLTVALMERYKHIGRPLTYSIALTCAHGLGLTPRGHGGRPGRNAVEQHLARLRNWLTFLYENYDLPALPTEVRDSMRPSMLARAAERFRQSG